MSLLDQELSTVGSRFRRMERWRGVSIVSIMLAIIGLAMLLMQVTAQWMHPNSGWMLLGAGAFALLSVWLTTYNQFRDNRWVANEIEKAYPELDQRLITTLDELDRNDGKPLGYLQHTVFQETISHSYYNPWGNVVPTGLLSAFRSRGLAAIFLVIAAAIGLMNWQPPAEAFVANSTQAKDKVALPQDFDIKIEPGDTEVEKGSSLIVVARFGKSVPKEATVIATETTLSSANDVAGAETTPSSSAVELRVPMSRSLDDPLFGGTISDIQHPFEYRVQYDKATSETYRITVFTYPQLVRADALLEHPSYTNIPDKRVEDTRRISVVEGTRATWEMHLNKPGINAELVPEDGGESIPLQVDSADPLNHLVTLELKESTTWRLSLTDADGRENRIQPTIKVKVTPNLAPKLKLELARDARVSPLEEFLVKATVSDDYGLNQYGLNYTLASAASKDVILGEESSRREKKVAEHELDFEALDAEPDQLLSYYFWAEDTDSNGNPRRTLSDMYFAEVRHFEEIFRQGEQQAGQQQQQQQQQQQSSQNGQDAEELAELQKQIINATWGMIRRELPGEPSDLFADDLSTIIESQQAASEQLQQLGENLEDPQSSEFLMDVQSNMNEAIKQLTSAYSEKSIESLTPAMNAERASYQSLLKLRAREHQVQQQQQQQQQQSQQRSASQQRMQQQLQELELKNDENRYETQRQAQEEEDAEQTEMRQALSRLRELAQRQEDLNEQLKELQNALEQAKTEEERDEIERQLKRLRDQQEEMLRDTDELMERLDESESQETMQETREQLEETREQMRESAESLQKGEVTPALASGTRAQRELEEMREELRRESANQFTDQMKDMRDRTRELEERQEEIGEQMQEQGETQQESGGLRREETPTGEREQELGDALREQNQKLNELLQEIEETVREAEETEPLLAESLYEAFRDMSENRTPERLERSAELTDRGLNKPAQQLEEEARESISEFRKKIDRAAESVLGDETDALRTAVRMLEDLERQLDDEIDQFNPPEDREGQPGEGQSREPGAEGETREGQRPGEEQESQDQERDPQDRGERQAGEEQERQERQEEQERQEDRERQRGQEGEGEQDGEQPGEGQPQDSQPQDGEPQEGQSQQPGQGGGQGSSEQEQQQQQQQPRSPSDQEAEQQGRNQPGQRPQGGLRDAQEGQRAGGRQDGGGFGGWEQLDIAPITGEDFREWSDRLRDVEEIVDDPELRAEAARIREQARSFRQDFKRHSEEPKWNLIQDLVARPLKELRQEVSEELLRRSAEKNALVPIDRDPVPEEFVEQVRRYYENLGSGKE